MAAVVTVVQTPRVISAALSERDPVDGEARGGSLRSWRTEVLPSRAWSGDHQCSKPCTGSQSCRRGLRGHSRAMAGRSNPSSQKKSRTLGARQRKVHRTTVPNATRRARRGADRRGRGSARPDLAPQDEEGREQRQRDERRDHSSGSWLRSGAVDTTPSRRPHRRAPARGSGPRAGGHVAERRADRRQPIARAQARRQLAVWRALAREHLRRGLFDVESARIVAHRGPAAGPACGRDQPHRPRGLAAMRPLPVPTDPAGIREAIVLPAQHLAG